MHKSTFVKIAQIHFQKPTTYAFFNTSQVQRKLVWEEAKKHKAPCCNKALTKRCAVLKSKCASNIFSIFHHFPALCFFRTSKVHIIFNVYLYQRERREEELVFTGFGLGRKWIQNRTAAIQQRKGKHERGYQTKLMQQHNVQRSKAEIQ